jgi:hypothetical protein
MLINNEHGTFVVLEDKIFHIESSHIFDVGPISEEELKEIILTSNYVAFRKNGLWHRENDLLAIIFADGTKSWYKNGLLHRENDLPTIIQTDGAKHWYQNGIFIRHKHVNQQ